jgi:hypothetical protein
MNILLPIAGKSSRFPNVRPKWMLTNPNGNLMIVDSVIDMKLDSIETINIVYLPEHEQKFQFKRGLIRNFEKYGLDKKLNFIELENETKNQVETVRFGLTKLQKDIPFFIKDSDNSFKLNYKKTDNNFLSYCKLEDFKGNDISSKSYIQMDNMDVITNIVEKKLISDKFCCGGYFFTSSKEFLNFSNIDSDNLYISDVIYRMMLNNKPFIGYSCSSYEDWGTLKSWNTYKSTFQTLFVDLDGTLVKNSSSYIPPYIGETDPIYDNVNYLIDLVKNGRTEIIITTARPEIYRQETESQLKKMGLEYKHLIMGLQHSKRIIINDFSNSNPYKTCDSINIQRDSGNLKNYLGL